MKKNKNTFKISSFTLIGILLSILIGAFISVAIAILFEIIKINSYG